MSETTVADKMFLKNAKSIAVLNGQYSNDYNLIAAASMMIALPTLVVYLALQKQFIGGLTLGANKG